MPSRAAVAALLVLASTAQADPIVVINTGAPAAVEAPGAAELPPAPVPVPPGPVQNVPWGSVSHINGQLVPVGQRNDYLLRFKRTNLSTNPIGFLFGYYGASLSVAVSDNVAVRGDLSVWSIEHDNRAGYEIGISAPIYFRRTHSGPFFEPGLLAHGDRMRFSPDYAGCFDCTAAPSDSTWVGPEMLFGWQWMFDSGLNVAGAFGAARRLGGSSSADPVPAGYFRIGYAF